MSFQPENFEASIGGYFGPSYDVELQSDGSLLYFQNSDIIIPTANAKNRNGITVTEDQWREFRKALDMANVWKWKDYYDSDILDGTQWNLRVEYKDAFLQSGGSNSFPPKQEFELFRTAVADLLGGRDF